MHSQETSSLFEGDLPALIDAIYRAESRRIYATLIRLIGDMQLAEEAMHDAFHVALSQWQDKGIPDNPRAWLISTARFKAIDQLRRQTHLAESLEAITPLSDSETLDWDGDIIEDDQLRLIFTCCHPALDPKLQIPLTLREVCGLTTEEIASAYLVSPSTMAQRIVRGKAKIRDSKLPFEIPERSQLAQRLDAVLAVVYLLFNEGYSATKGDTLLRVELSSEAIRLSRQLLELMQDSEIEGLLALMLLHQSRSASRTNSAGDIILLEDQDRSLWAKDLIDEGRFRVGSAFVLGSVGFYTLQAAISACHAQAPTWQETDWQQIVQLYEALSQVDPSPIVDLNKAVAVSMLEGAEAGLKIISLLIRGQELEEYHLLHAAHGELLSRTGDLMGARSAFERALSLTNQEAERRVLKLKMSRLDAI